MAIIYKAVAFTDFDDTLKYVVKVDIHALVSEISANNFISIYVTIALHFGIDEYLTATVKQLKVLGNKTDAIRSKLYTIFS